MVGHNDRSCNHKARLRGVSSMKDIGWELGIWGRCVSSTVIQGVSSLIFSLADSLSNSNGWIPIIPRRKSVVQPECIHLRPCVWTLQKADLIAQMYSFSGRTFRRLNLSSLLRFFSTSYQAQYRRGPGVPHWYTHPDILEALASLLCDYP